MSGNRAPTFVTWHSESLIALLSFDRSSFTVSVIYGRLKNLMKHSTRLATISYLLLCLSLISVASLAHAELQPNQIVILANSKSPESLAVASHYAARRGVPTTHIVLLDLPLHDNLTRQEYQFGLAPPASARICIVQARSR